MRKMVVTKPFTYRTRRLQADDVEEFNDAQARLLERTGRARMYIERRAARPPKPTSASASASASDAATIPPRLEEAARSVGLKVDKRWGEQRLREEIVRAEEDRGIPAMTRASYYNKPSTSPTPPTPDNTADTDEDAAS
jgi:hypothetical protein